jgi:hypothetical protein
MQRLRFSPFQVRLMRVLHAHEQKHKSSCDPNSRLVKAALYGRQRGLSTSERVTLHRSVARLDRSGMIAEEEPGSRCYRLTEKGQAWLEAHAPPEPPELEGPPQVRPEGQSRVQRLAFLEGLVRSAAKNINYEVSRFGGYLDLIRAHELWKDEHPDWSWADYLRHRADQLLAGVTSAQAALTELLDVVRKSKGKK